ncbi:hypothetical protein FRB94_011805 [Tulasnella sp. JGI-2019a]|nr:hypothetical protein FRB94_011805 [Tulasnella sp. JGI-2019a]
MQDGATSSRFTAVERTKKLRALMTAWEDISGATETVYEVDRMAAYDLKQGILGHAVHLDQQTTAISFHRLPSRISEVDTKSWTSKIPAKIADFAMDPSQDLLITVEDGGGGPDEMLEYHVNILLMTCGNEHPLAAKSSFRITATCHKGAMQREDFQMSIRGPLLALSASTQAESRGIRLMWWHLWVWDWRKGAELTAESHQGQAGFALLGNYSYVCFRVEPERNNYSLNITNFSPDPTLPQQTINLGLPQLATGTTIYKPGCNLHLDTAFEQLAHNITSLTTQDTRIFNCASDEAILQLSFRAMSNHPTATVIPFYLHIHYAAVVMIFSKMQRDGTHHKPWKDWGPQTTRWLRESDLSDINGLRYMRAEVEEGHLALFRMSDYNSHAVPRPHPIDYLGVPQVELPHLFDGPIVSHLRFRESHLPTPKSLHDINGLIFLRFDEEHILLYQWGQDHKLSWTVLTV